MYADIIIDIQTEKLDRVFEYEIPKEFEEHIGIGSQVTIPFGAGNQKRNGYVVATSPSRRYKGGEVKAILDVPTQNLGVEGDLVSLAGWMSQTYGSTFLQSLKTVIPVKTKVRQRVHRTYFCGLSKEELTERIALYQRKKYKAKLRILEAFTQVSSLTEEMMERELNISATTLQSMIEQGELYEETDTLYRNRTFDVSGVQDVKVLNQVQTQIVEDVMAKYREGNRTPCYIHGITGSGKTLVYMELVSRMICQGKQVIVLIPEISLTAQTVMRFYRRFGDRVSFVNSRLSKGERYDQYVRAKNGEIDIMIGPRSALFTPFSNLGMIIIDEEHDQAYKSEQSPRYNSVEVAAKRCKIQDAVLVMGSATPSLEAYYRCQQKEYRLYEMTRRAVEGSRLPDTSVVDLREELKEGNRSIFSRELRMRMEEALGKGQQVMLFLNRRGYAGFVSCRSCGYSFSCPHCEISLTAHRSGILKCHYCGYQIPMPSRCPQCGSPYIASFGLGTEKVENAVHQVFPQAKTLIMDRDTTARKNSMEEILNAFSSHEADVLIGTQMIVKGHDFPDVTVMGILAADMSLHMSDYRSGERTFQLITQAAGRAGRGKQAGYVVIQTYQPEHYVIETAARQDYQEFYRQELLYRKLLGYPPCGRMMEITCFSMDDKKAYEYAKVCVKIAEVHAVSSQNVLFSDNPSIVSKHKDIYRRTLYVKSERREQLVEIKDNIMRQFEQHSVKDVWLQFDFQ